MKKTLIYSLAAMLFMMSCRKNDNPKLVGVERVPLPQLTIDASADQVIKSDAPDAFSGKFTVGMYYADDVKPQKLDIVVIKNNDKTKIKTIQTNVTTFPSSVTFTGTQIKALFGTSSVLGDSYTIGADITTKDGKVYPAFSTAANQNNSNIGSLAGASPTITYGALCGFHIEDYGTVGTSVPYKVVKDGWADYSVGDIIPVQIVDATHLSFEYAASNPKPIIIAVDPATNKTSVASQTFGDYALDNKVPPTMATFTTASVAGSADNQVLPCAATISVRLSFSDSKGNSYPAGTITLQKQ